MANYTVLPDYENCIVNLPNSQSLRVILQIFSISILKKNTKT